MMSINDFSISTFISLYLLDLISVLGSRLGLWITKIQLLMIEKRRFSFCWVKCNLLVI